MGAMKARVPALDALRGIAAALVFVHHAQLPGLHPATVGLDVGVMLFFVLSGYLLYTPLIARPSTEAPVRGAAAFLVRRVFRIYPGYLVALAGSAWLYGVPVPSPVDVVTMGPSSLLVAWTLRIELAFYLLLPLLAFALRGATQRTRVRVLLLGAIASLLVGLASMAGAHVVNTDWPAWLFAFVPGMLVGELVLAGHPWLERLGQRRWLAVGVALLAASAIPDIRYADLPGAAGAAILVAWCVARPRLGTTGARIAVAAGAVSYGVYLWHLPLLEALDRPSSWAGAGVVVATTLAIAAVTYLVVEAPGISAGAWVARRIQAGRIGMPGRAAVAPPRSAPAEAEPAGT